MPDQVLDHMIIGLVTMALYYVSYPIGKAVSEVVKR